MVLVLESSEGPRDQHRLLPPLAVRSRSDLEVPAIVKTRLPSFPCIFLILAVESATRLAEGFGVSDDPSPNRRHSGQ